MPRAHRGLVRIVREGPSRVSQQVRGRLGGRYRLDEPIGYGGMGRVYRAHDELLDRDVAVKLLNDLSLDAQAMAEARATARVSHPGIVHVFDVGTDNNVTFIVLELVPGQCLRELLKQRGSLTPSEAVNIAAQIADALDAAHREGLVHCDIKPGNLIVTPSGQTKLIDFGIAQAQTLPTDEVRGSAAYVAPEQVSGGNLDGRADVYALGAVLYEMLVGRPPFVGATAAEILRQRLQESARPPRGLEPAIPPRLDAIVRRALERDPSRRFGSASEFRDALIAAGLSAAPTEVMPIPERKPARRRIPLRLRHRRSTNVLVSAVAILFAAATMAAVIGSRSAHSDAVPKLVGLRLSQVPAALVQAGISPADTTVLTRPVQPQYVDTVVDQEPQPGLPRNGRQVQIAVGVSP